MIANRIFRSLLYGCLLAGGSGFSQSENWSMWRDPRGDGTNLESSVPTQ
jgi:hypothetical protein